MNQRPFVRTGVERRDPRPDGVRGVGPPRELDLHPAPAERIVEVIDDAEAELPAAFRPVDRGGGTSASCQAEPELGPESVRPDPVADGSQVVRATEPVADADELQPAVDAQDRAGRASPRTR